MHRVSALVAAALLGYAFPALADEVDAYRPLYTSSFYELSYFQQSGGVGAAGPAFAGGGLHLFERSGNLAKLFQGLFIGAAAGIAEGSSLNPVVTSTTTERQNGDYIERTTITTSRQKTPEEVARARAAADAAMATRQTGGHADLQVFVPQGERSAKGLAFALYPYSFAGQASLDFGFHVHRVRDRAELDGTGSAASRKRDLRSAGLSLRVGTLLYRNLVSLDGEFHANLWYLSKGDDPNTATEEVRRSTMRAGLTLNPIERVLIRASLVSTVNFDDVGWGFDLGVRL